MLHHLINIIKNAKQKQKKNKNQNAIKDIYLHGE